MGGCNETDAKEPTPKKPVQESSPEAPAPAKASDEIAIETAQFETPDVKILTLGAGECGKSTIWRQLKLLYCGGFDEDEIETNKSVIRINVIADIKTLLEAVHRNDETIAQELQSSVELVNDLQGTDDEFTPEVADAISQIWADPIAKHTFKTNNSIGLGDNAGFFLDSVKRIADPNYVPTSEDILKSRIRTTGISNLDFKIKNINTQLTDVGGQKSERSRWQKCFTNVDYLLFVVSLSDFDQVMFEEEGTSRTVDSMNLFSQIANSNIFENKPIFLVLNKKDLFTTKLRESPDKFREAYPGFDGDINNVDKCIEHVQKAFLDQIDANRSAEAWIEPIPTCAMSDTEIRSLFQKIAKKIIDGQKPEEGPAE